MQAGKDRSGALATQCFGQGGTCSRKSVNHPALTLHLFTSIFASPNCPLAPPRCLPPLQKRVDDLEAFYLAHVDDERSVLFEKQRLKLRKLLHEYDSAIPGAGAYGASAGRAGSQQQFQQQHQPGSPAGTGGGAGPAAAPPATTTRTIREDTRLVLQELLAWFLQVGIREMPECSAEVVEKVFNNITRTNLDGKMSVRDLRQWYLTFGKKSLREGLPLDPQQIVTTSYVTKASGAVTMKKVIAAASGSSGPGLHVEGPMAALAASARSAAAAAEGGAGLSRSTKPLYAWEREEDAGAAGGYFGSTGGSGPLALPNGMLEFQVRCTPEEFQAIQLKRRMLEAEEKYRSRIAAAKEKGERATRDSFSSWNGGATPADKGISELVTGPYVDPGAKEALILRSP